VRTFPETSISTVSGSLIELPSHTVQLSSTNYHSVDSPQLAKNGSKTDCLLWIWQTWQPWGALRNRHSVGSVCWRLLSGLACRGRT